MDKNTFWTVTSSLALLVAMAGLCWAAIGYLETQTRVFSAFDALDRASVPQNTYEEDLKAEMLGCARVTVDQRMRDRYTASRWTREPNAQDIAQAIKVAVPECQEAFERKVALNQMRSYSSFTFIF